MEMSLEGCPQLTMQREQKEKQTKKRDCPQMSTPFICNCDLPCGWTEVNLLADFISHYIFQGPKPSRVMNLVFGLRDQSGIIEEMT